MIELYASLYPFTIASLLLPVFFFLKKKTSRLSHILGIIGITIPLAAFFLNSYYGGSEKLRSPIDYSVLGDV